MKRRMGREQCPRFQFCSPPSPPWWHCLPLRGRKVRASVGWRSPQTLPGPQAKLGHFIPTLKSHTPGLEAGVEPRKKYSPSEVGPVCSGCLVPAKTGVPEPNSGWPREGEATPALDPERVGALRLRRAGRGFCGFFTRIVKRAWCMESVLLHSGRVGENTGLLGVGEGRGWDGSGGMWLTLPSDTQVQRSLPSPSHFGPWGTLFWFLVLLQISTS